MGEDGIPGGGEADRILRGWDTAMMGSSILWAFRSQKKNIYIYREFDQQNLFIYLLYTIYIYILYIYIYM